MPGDLGPKLGIAAAAGASGDIATAARFYRIVAAIDPAYGSAGFGLARCCLADGDPHGAAALAAIPPSSSMFTEWRLVLAEVLTAVADPAVGGSVEQVGQTLASVKVDSGRLHQSSVTLLNAASKTSRSS